MKVLQAKRVWKANDQMYTDWLTSNLKVFVKSFFKKLYRKSTEYFKTDYHPMGYAHTVW